MDKRHFKQIQFEITRGQIYCWSIQFMSRHVLTKTILNVGYNFFNGFNRPGTLMLIKYTLLVLRNGNKNGPECK